MHTPSPDTIAVLAALYYAFPVVLLVGAIWIGVEIIRGDHQHAHEAGVDDAHLDDGE
jgi:hypothetical protein